MPELGRKQYSERSRSRARARTENLGYLTSEITGHTRLDREDSGSVCRCRCNCRTWKRFGSVRKLLHDRLPLFRESHLSPHVRTLVSRPWDMGYSWLLVWILYSRYRQIIKSCETSLTACASDPPQKHAGYLTVCPSTAAVVSKITPRETQQEAVGRGGKSAIDGRQVHALQRLQERRSRAQGHGGHARSPGLWRSSGAVFLVVLSARFRVSKRVSVTGHVCGCVVSYLRYLQFVCWALHTTCCT